MDIPPDVLKEVIQAGLPTLSEGTKGFLRRLLGPATTEVGILLQDTVRGWRFGNQIRVLKAAESQLLEAGIEPGSVPLRVLVPLLEGAALEDDEEMSERWASLLANAANPNSGCDVRSFFSEILRQLAPIDARILDFYNSTTNSLKMSLIESKLPNISSNDISISLDNLVRLGLCEKLFPDEQPKTGLNAFQSLIERSPKEESMFRRFMGPELPNFRITSMGTAFIAACKSPDNQN